MLSPLAAVFPNTRTGTWKSSLYVREGAISHQDNLGNKGRTEAGDVQVMSAGTGIAHSEYNLESTATRIFQIWIIPNEEGLAPSWGAKPFPQGLARRLRDLGQWQGRR